MKPVTIRDVRWLIEHREQPCVSVYVALDPVQPGGATDQARLDALLREAARRLRQVEPQRDVERLMLPMAEKTRGPWPSRARAIALFRSPDVNLAFTLPVEVPDVIVVASSFHTKPLVSYLDRGRYFFVLTLEEDSVRLLEGTPDRLVDITGEAIPADLHTRARARGAAEARGVAERRSWYRAVDEGVSEHLRPTEASLVLAGARARQSLFRSVSDYPWLLDGGVDTVDALAPKRLHALAWGAVRAHQAELESEAATQYLEAAHAGRGTDVLAEVIAAVGGGRVRLLLHREGAHLWGRMDPETGAFALRAGHEDLQPGDSDLVDDLCEATLVRGGTILEVARDRMPTDAAVAAILS